MEMLHNQMNREHKVILLESGEDKLEGLKIASRLETFEAMVSASLGEFYTEKEAINMGLDKPTGGQTMHFLAQVEGQCDVK